MTDSPSYPRRDPFFAHRVTRLLFKSCAAQSLGHHAICLIIHIAHTEDAARYQGAVTFWNGQLMETLGFKSPKQLNEARKIACEAGWLHYERDGDRAVGNYWCLVPECVGQFDDAPIEEPRPILPRKAEQASPEIHSDSRSDSRSENGMLSEFGTQSGTRSGMHCGTHCGTQSGKPLIPIPSPIPKREKEREREARVESAERCEDGTRLPDIGAPAPLMATATAVTDAIATATRHVAGWRMPTNAAESRHREALALWQAARKGKHGSYLPEAQWEAVAIQRAAWDSDRWHAALMTSAADGTANLATHGQEPEPRAGPAPRNGRRTRIKLEPHHYDL